MSNAKAEAELEKTIFHTHIHKSLTMIVRVSKSTFANDISKRMTPTINTGVPSPLTHQLHSAFSRMFTAIGNILTAEESGENLHSDVPTPPSVTGINGIGVPISIFYL